MDYQLPLLSANTHFCFVYTGESYERHRDLKFLKEAFSHESCVRLFYTNDLRVIMDILVREIRDLSDEASPESVCIQLVPPFSFVETENKKENKIRQ